MLKTIRHYFPDFFERMSLFKDQRKRKDYSVAELVTGCIALFRFKEGGRNAINNDRKEVRFRDNYFRLFKLRLPHMDTVEDFLHQLDCDTLRLVSWLTKHIRLVSSLKKITISKDLALQ